MQGGRLLTKVPNLFSDGCEEGDPVRISRIRTWYHPILSSSAQEARENWSRLKRHMPGRRAGGGRRMEPFEREIAYLLSHYLGVIHPSREQ